MIPLLYYKRLNKVKMKNLSRKLVIGLVLAIGVLSFTSCTDNNEKLINEIERSTTPGNNGEIDNGDDEETGNE